MKKAVMLLALSWPVVCVHAQSNVVVYGLVDAAVTYGDPGGAGSRVYRLDSGVSAGSRLGFRSTEDLGSGLKATAVLEMGFGADTGTFQQGGLPWGRQVFVGLTGSRWTLTAGRQYTPNDISVIGSDAFGQVYWGGSVAYGIGSSLQSPGSGLGAGCQGATVRMNNSVQGTYTAGPVTGKLMVAAGDENAQGSGRFVSPNLTYAQGPLMLTAGYARMRQCAPDIPAGADPAWQKEVVIGGSYDFGVARLYAGYYNWNPSEANKAVTSTTYVDHVAKWVGVRIPVGKGTVITQVARLEQEFRGQADGRGTILGATYEYPLSKRTKVYASGARLKNNEGAQFTLFGATTVQAAAGLGADPKVLSLGMAHTF